MNIDEQRVILTDMQQATLDYCQDMLRQLAAMCEAQDLKEQAAALAAVKIG